MIQIMPYLRNVKNKQYFSGETIRMGNLDATDEDVMNVCKKCGIHDFIMNLENGYNTIVGDSGSHLSGGERQRIAIARAVLLVKQFLGFTGEILVQNIHKL